jgi:hypothetical protein
MTCFWIRIRHWGTARVHARAVLFVGWTSYLKNVSPFLFNLLMRENWSAEDDGHPRTPCSLQPPCFVTIDSECCSTLDAFRGLNENNSNAVRDICWSPPFLLCHVSRSVTNSDVLRQVPARAVTSTRKASSKKMSQSFFNWARRPGFWVRPRNKTSELKKAQQNTWHVQRNQERANQKSNLCSFVFFYHRGWCTRNLCLKIKLFTRPSVDGSFNGCVFYQTLLSLDFCSTTMLLPSHLALLDVTRTLLIGLAAPRIHQISPHVPFFSSRGSNTAYETVDGIQRTVSDDALKLTEDFQ